MNPLHLVAICLASLVYSVNGAKNAKRGLAFAESVYKTDIKQVNTTKSVISWQYDWGQSPPSYLAQSNIPYVPMQWGTNGESNFSSLVKQQGIKIALGFNEPDLGGQSNLTASQAATLWKTYINPLKDSGVRLGAPAISGGPTGRPWLSSFLAACTGCQIDFIPIHWYGEGIGNFYDYIWQVHGQFPNYPLWITEFACTSSDSTEVLNFLNSTITYLDTLDWIERYSWFAFFRQETGNSFSLMDANGNLNALGKIYINNGA